MSQTLFSASIIAESLPRLWERKPQLVRERLGDLAQLTHGALAEMRALLLELRPHALTEESLPVLLKQLVGATASRTHTEILLEAEPTQALPPEVQVALYRIAQEALNNMVKHAAATRAQVLLSETEAGVELRILDDGQGFDPETISAHQMGLRIMRERAGENEIALEIGQRSNGGAEIYARWVRPDPKKEEGL